MTSVNRYATSWESFWSSTTGTVGEVFWDADPIHASRQDLALFRGYFDPRLPLIDLGCGNGTQTRFLTGHFATVLGTEIAPAAIELAGRTNSADNITYRLLDMLHPDDAQRLHDEIGDANIYTRTVLHQLAPADHATAVQSIEQLLGTTGTLYLIELSSAAESFFTQLIQQYGPPPGLARVLQHQITPGMLHDNPWNHCSRRIDSRFLAPARVRSARSTPSRLITWWRCRLSMPFFVGRKAGFRERLLRKLRMANGYEKGIIMELPGPLDVVSQLVTAMNACDLESALTLFESGASFVMKPGVVVQGTAGIRQALEGFMALKPMLTINYSLLFDPLFTFR